MNEELNKIFDLCQFILINKSSPFIAFLEKNNILNVNNNNNINNGDNINAEKIQIIIDILKQTIKLFKEYINWFEYDKIFDLNIIEHLLHVFKYCDPCKVELIECFGKLFELNISEIQYTDEETLRGIIFGVYNQRYFFSARAGIHFSIKDRKSIFQFFRQMNLHGGAAYCFSPTAINTF